MRRKKQTASHKKSARVIALIVEFSVIAAFIFTSIYSLSSFSEGCENIKESVLRLHVIANSDSEYDQQMKLLVRDAVLEKGKELFGSCQTLQQVRQTAASHTELIRQTADAVLLQNGCRCRTQVSVCRAAFDTREYDSFTLPAGVYDAVRIVIGEGKGHNWWCVLFPPLCLPACEEGCSPEDILNEKGLDVINASPKYEIRFKIVEWIESLRNKKRA